MSIRRTYHITEGPTQWLFEVELPSRRILGATRHEFGEDFWEAAYYSEASPEVRLKLNRKINTDPRGPAKK